MTSTSCDRSGPLQQDRSPSFSPDGRRLAYVHVAPNAKTPITIFIKRIAARDRNAAGAAVLHAGGQSAISSVAFMGGGSNLVYSARPPRERDYEIFTIGVNGKERRRLTFDRADDLDPASSPNGRKIAWTKSPHVRDRSEVTPNSDVLIMNRNGSHVRRLTRGPLRDRHPNFSPNGRLLAFQRDVTRSTRTYHPEIFRIRASGGDLRRLTHTPFLPTSNEDEMLWPEDPAFAPNGRRIVVDAGIGGSGRRIFTIRSDGSRPRVLIDRAPATTPDWGRQPTR